MPVFEDETNFNQHIRRGRGRTRRAACKLPGQEQEEETYIT